jgi:AbrB family looped-hinge helix DNA binding protein
MATTKVSERGQVVIPKPIRDKLGLKRGQVLEVSEEMGAIVMRAAKRGPASKVPTRWQDFRGILAGTTALQDHMEDHRREIESGD